jgi:hypothetical protein
MPKPTIASVDEAESTPDPTDGTRGVGFSYV